MMTQREKIINYLEKIAPKAATTKRICKVCGVTEPVAIRIISELRDEALVNDLGVLSSDGRLAFVWVGF